MEDEVKYKCMEAKIVEKLDIFFSKYKFQKYKKGELLIRADENPTGVYYLKKGIVKEYAISKKGEELIVNMFKTGAFFPMSYALNNTRNEYFFEASEDLELWKAPKDTVVNFLNDNPDVMIDLLKRVYRGTDGLILRITYLMTGSAYSRLIVEILIYIKRFGMDSSKILEITEKDLAAQAGMTRETISREMKILKDKNLIKIEKNRISIVDIEKLEMEIAGGV